MKDLEYLCDPYTKEDLFFTKTIFKNKAGEEYVLTEGIPIFIQKDKLNKHLLGQIEYFKEEMTNAFGENYEISPWQKTYVERFLAEVGDVRGKMVLDSGTGSGYMAIELAKRGAYVVASDLTLQNLVKLKMVAQKEGLLENIRFICCSAEDLPFKDNIFDYYISNAVLEHLPREKEAILEIKRVLKEKGILMITVPLSYKYLNPIFLPINIIYDKKIGHLRRYNHEILRKKLKGLKHKKTYYTGHTGKVFRVLGNMVLRKSLFNEEIIEEYDKKNAHEKWFASNIISFYTKVK